MEQTQDIGVVFDMDGVLVDSAEPHFVSWQQLAEEVGTPVTQEQFAETFGRQNRDIIPKIFGESSEERMVQLADRKEQLYRDLVRKSPPLVTGAKELIQSLQTAGVRLAIGSSAPRLNIELVLDALDATDVISVIVSGDDVARGKPDPQVFQLACDRLGLAPQRCIVVEDAPIGIDAGRAAGARTVAVLMHHPAEAFHWPDLIVPKLSDLTCEALLALVEKA